MTLRRSDLHGYQDRAQQFVKDNPRSALLLEMGLGKQQPISEPVLTPQGWRPIGELNPGDMVVGSDGQPTEVTAIYPQSERKTYRITFSDGAWARAGPEHLWQVSTPGHRHRGKPWRVLSTQEILQDLTFANGDSKWSVPLISSPVILPHAELPIDPYLLGVALGDGAITHTGYCTLCTDIEIIEACYLPVHRAHPSPGIGYAILLKETRKHICALQLNGKRSWEKHIPDLYLWADAKQRLALLQGLLDTDGSPMKDGGVEYCSTSEDLVDSAIWLIESLGGIARNKSWRITQHQNGEGRPSWRINVKLPQEVSPFRLSRKLAAWKRPTKYPALRVIRKITLDTPEDSICISVAAKDGLYLTRSCIVTHNTAATLTAISDMLDTLEIYGVLILGPLRVIESVWQTEACKWSHTCHLDICILRGSVKHKMMLLNRKHDIYLINYDQLTWLINAVHTLYLSHGRYPPFDMLVLDELNAVKDHTSQRAKALQYLLEYFPRRTGLTGTPASNGLTDLFGQFLALDDGHRLGNSKEAYLGEFFHKKGYGYTPRGGASKSIYSLIEDMTLTMKNEEYLQLPPLIINDIYIDLPPRAREIYDEMEASFFVELDSGAVLDIANSASLASKCLQIANGAVYTDPETKAWDPIHDVKLDVLDEIIGEANRSPVLVAYAFRTDAFRIEKKYKKSKLSTVNITDTKESTVDVIARWNRGEYDMMLGHPQSMGHGLNLQEGDGHQIVMFGLTWRLDLYDQVLARLLRQGQRAPRVILHRILARDTWDEVVKTRLEGKAQTEEALKQALIAYRKRRGV